MSNWHALSPDEIFRQSVWTSIPSIPRERQKRRAEKRPKSGRLKQQEDEEQFIPRGSPVAEARALLVLLKRESVDEVRELIRVSDTDRRELEMILPHCHHVYCEFRGEVLAAFDKLVAEGKLEQKPPQGSSPHPRASHAKPRLPVNGTADRKPRGAYRKQVSIPQNPVAAD
jgi:hypothetical protein